MKNKKYTYISLFSSAGIGCYGFKMEDYECVATNELIERRLNVQKCNHKCKYDSGYICGDITLDETKNKLFDEIKLWNKKENIDNIDVVIATPPCQGMSVANLKKNNEINRNSLVIESIKIIKEIKPKIFIFENVSAFLKTACIDVDDKIKSIEEAINNNLDNDYVIMSRVINFKDYGSNSSRTRTLVIGVRMDFEDYISPIDLFPGNIPSSNPTRNTTGNSSPFALCNVIRVTESSESSIPSISLLNVIPSKKSPKVFSASSSSNSIATVKNSSKFSILDSASVVFSSSNAFTYPVLFKVSFINSDMLNSSILLLKYSIV